MDLEKNNQTDRRNTPRLTTVRLLKQTRGENVAPRSWSTFSDDHVKNFTSPGNHLHDGAPSRISGTVRDTKKLFERML